MAEKKAKKPPRFMVRALEPGQSAEDILKEIQEQYPDMKMTVLGGGGKSMADTVVKDADVSIEELEALAAPSAEGKGGVFKKMKAAFWG